MRHWDWLVGGVTILLGLLLAVSAVAGAPWLMELRRPKWLVAKIGAGPAKGVIVALGLVCVALGVLIVSGWRPPWAR